jgi:hypothetical protein
MDSNAEAELAWLQFSEANLAHQGHDTKGLGSPITQIVLERTGARYHEIHMKLSEALNPETANADFLK